MSDANIFWERKFPFREMRIVRWGGGIAVDETPVVVVNFFAAWVEVSCGDLDDGRRPLRSGEIDMFASCLDTKLFRVSGHRDLEVSGTPTAYAYRIDLITMDGETIRLGFQESPGIPIISQEPEIAPFLSWIQYETLLGDMAELRRVFSANLTRLVREQGMRMSRLAEATGISRQVISLWVTTQSLPNSDNFDRICVALNCTRAMLFAEPQEHKPLLTITQWAKRESITKRRAEDLISLGLVEGAIPTAYGFMFPEDIKAPKDTLREVMLAKRRPWWVRNFHQNFPRLVEGKSKSAIARQLGITPAAVGHWATKKGYPVADRLPDIAAILGVDVQQLTDPNPLSRHTSPRDE